MINTSSTNLLSGQSVVIIWCWQWDVAADHDLAPSPRVSVLDNVGSDEEDGSKADDEVLAVDNEVEDKDGENLEEDELEPEGSDNDVFSSSLVTHTVVFKCIGVTQEKAYQTTLLEANSLLQNGEDVPVCLTPEPNNPHDSQAIAFECQLKDKKWKIGYIVHEALEETHKALNYGDILNVHFGWIKYITDWVMSGPGFFARIKISKQGDWPASIVHCSSTRLH